MAAACAMAMVVQTPAGGNRRSGRHSCDGAGDQPDGARDDGARERPERPVENPIVGESRVRAECEKRGGEKQFAHRVPPRDIVDMRIARAERGVAVTLETGSGL